MEWTPGQARALDAVGEWLRRDDDPVFRLFGYAGTGKTTLARHLAAQSGGEVRFAAFTGKAASVMRRRGCDGASTLHSLIYRSRQGSKEQVQALEQDVAMLRMELRQEHGEDYDLSRSPELKRLTELLDRAREAAARPYFVLNTESELREADLLVVDECSMVDGRMGEDILSFGVKVLVLGDPAQLPPVMGEGYFTAGRPDAMLEEVQRQALGSPIIELATRVRAGGRLEPGQYGESRVVPYGVRIEPEDAMAHDQIIVGKNVTRRAFNARARSLLGRSSWAPEPEDRLICLRNDHQAGFLNGEMWRCLAATIDPENQDAIMLDLASDEEPPRPQTACAYSCLFRGEKPPSFSWGNGMHEFDFGYAVTCHKSQGSQWGSVLVVDESRVFRDDRHRWLYTALTRAAERVTVLC